MPVDRVARETQAKAMMLWPVVSLKAVAAVAMLPRCLPPVELKRFTRRKNVLEHSCRIFGVALLCLAIGQSQALTLGRIRGAALVGQSLNVVIPVQLDAGEDAASLCFEADVFHADTRQDGSHVRVQVEATAQAANIRVMSSALVDEPVVTVYLRTGCGQKTSRRYVLLADMPSEVAAPAVQLALPFVTPARASAQFEASRSPTESSPAVKVKKIRTPRPAGPAKVPEQRAGKAAPAPSSVPQEKSKAGQVTGQSRLKLDPLDFLSDRVANLEFPVPITTPEETLRNLQRMQALEGAMKTLQASAAKSEASVLSLTTRLQQAEAARFPAALVYGLIALVLACLAAVAWLWSRQRSLPTGGEHWWADSVAPPAAPDVATVFRPVIAESLQELKQSPLAEQEKAEASSGLAQDSRLPPAVDVNLMEMSDSFFDDFMQSDPEHSASRKLPPLAMAAAGAGLARKLNSEVTLDIRRQAEFFVSLGQVDQAARLLKRQIRESESPNPFEYLDLLSALHSLGLKAEFQQYRERFNHLFTGVVPEFAAFKAEGQGLEVYPEVLTRLTTLWETPGVLDAIDACIFRGAAGTAHQPSFDLAAFRDLLLLQAVAHPVVLLPRLPAGAPELESQPEASASVPAAGALAGMDLDLDLDLSAPEMADFAAHFSATEHVDLQLPEVDGDASAVQGEDAVSPSMSGNLIDFDLPPTASPPGKPAF
jgi:pilus assembly protein FimV